MNKENREFQQDTGVEDLSRKRSTQRKTNRTVYLPPAINFKEECTLQTRCQMWLATWKEY